MKKLLAVVTVYCGLIAGQANPPLTLYWPTSDKPTLKLTFGKFIQKGMVDTQGIYVSDVTVQNVSDQGMPRSVFTVFIADSNGVRIGRGRLQLPDIAPYRSQTAQLQFSAVGAPAGVSLLAGKTIPLRVISVPPGASLKIDGQDAGMTPKIIDFTVAKHTLEFSKEGYSTGTTELEVGADELPGGSISFELGSLSQDTVELRDGTVVQGDVMSLSMNDVVVRVEGKDQKYGRNEVKKIMLVERVSAQPVPAKPADGRK